MAKEGKIKKDKADKPAKDYGLSGPGSSVPDEESRFTISDHVDELLLISPREKKEATTDFGTKEITEADVVILDPKNPTESKEYPSAWIFAAVVQSQLGQALANRSRVVGTLIVDTASKKSGQSAPYRLTAPSDSDINVAKAYLDALDPLR